MTEINMALKQEERGEGRGDAGVRRRGTAPTEAPAPRTHESEQSSPRGCWEMEEDKWLRNLRKSSGLILHFLIWG